MRIIQLGIFLVSLCSSLLAKKPNVLLIMVDDLGAAGLGCYGNTIFSTPNLDKMSSEGARFDNAYSTPVCSPTRAMILTGLYPNRTGILERMDSAADKEKLQNRLPAHLKTFGTVFKDAGYATAIAGKWHLGNFRTYPDQPMSHGFDDYCLWVQHLDGKIHSRYHAPHIRKNGQFIKYENDVYGPDVFSDYLIDFMKKNKDKPFLAYYPMVLVHGKNDPPGPHTLAESKLPAKMLDSKNKIAARMVTYMDKVVGKLLKALDDLDLAKDTLVIFTGDNGSQSASVLADYSFTGGKRCMNEAGTRTPFIVRWPGKVPVGPRDQIFSQADVLPTLASVANIPLTHKVDGMDLSHNFFGKEGKDREYFYMAYEGDCWFVRDKRFRLHEDGRFYDSSFASNTSRYSMVALDKSEYPEHRARLQKKLDEFMRITKTDDSYSIVPFGVKGDKIKERILRIKSKDKK